LVRIVWDIFLLDVGFDFVIGDTFICKMMGHPTCKSDMV